MTVDEMSAEWSARSWPSGWSVQHIAETGSTNTDLLAAAAAGTAGDRSVLATDHQTAGRGRLDRRWEAPAGANLLVSMLFLPDDDGRSRPDRRHPPGLLTQMVALATVRSLDTIAGGSLMPELGLKWPNDVMFDERKLAGILAQHDSSTGATVVGVGLNVRWSPDGAASVRGDVGIDATPAVVLAALLTELSALLVGPANDEGPALQTSVTRTESGAYRERLVTLGRDVRVLLPANRELRGRAVDIDSSGRLVVEGIDGTRHVLDVGDVVHLRPA